jgi:hypothetical protein
MITALILFTVVVLYRLLLGFAGGDISWLPNFAPVAAIALCGPSLFPRRVALVLPLAILLVSDIALNAHYGAAIVTGEMFARYLVLGMVALGGLYLRGSNRAGRFALGSIAGSTAFYIVTNTVSWLTSVEYAKTSAGWWQALTVGIPGYPPTLVFFRNSLVSDLVFTLLCVGCLAMGRRLATGSGAAVPTQAPVRG